MTPNAKITMITVKNGRSTGLIAIVAFSTSVAAQLLAVWWCCRQTFQAVLSVQLIQSVNADPVHNS